MEKVNREQFILYQHSFETYRELPDCIRGESADMYRRLSVLDRKLDDYVPCKLGYCKSILSDENDATMKAEVTTVFHQDVGSLCSWTLHIDFKMTDERGMPLECKLHDCVKKIAVQVDPRLFPTSSQRSVVPDECLDGVSCTFPAPVSHSAFDGGDGGGIETIAQIQFYLKETPPRFLLPKDICDMMCVPHAQQMTKREIERCLLDYLFDQGLLEDRNGSVMVALKNSTLKSVVSISKGSRTHVPLSDLSKKILENLDPVPPITMYYKVKFQPNQIRVLPIDESVNNANVSGLHDDVVCETSKLMVVDVLSMHAVDAVQRIHVAEYVHDLETVVDSNMMRANRLLTDMMGDLEQHLAKFREYDRIASNPLSIANSAMNGFVNTADLYSVPFAYHCLMERMHKSAPHNDIVIR